MSLESYIIIDKKQNLSSSKFSNKFLFRCVHQQDPSDCAW